LPTIIVVERLGNNLACDRHPSKILSIHSDTKPPNEWRISRAATIDR